MPRPPREPLGKASAISYAHNFWKPDTVNMPTNSSTIMIPWSSQQQLYSLHLFDPIVTEGRITEAELRSVIDQISKVEFYEMDQYDSVAALFFVPVVNLFYLLSGGPCIRHCQVRDKVRKRTEDIKAILAVAQQQVFAAKDATISISENGGYIKISMDWKIKAMAAPQFS